MEEGGPICSLSSRNCWCKFWWKKCACILSVCFSLKLRASDLRESQPCRGASEKLKGRNVLDQQIFFSQKTKYYACLLIDFKGEGELNGSWFSPPQPSNPAPRLYYYYFDITLGRWKIREGRNNRTCLM